MLACTGSSWIDCEGPTKECKAMSVKRSEADRGWVLIFRHVENLLCVLSSQRELESGGESWLNLYQKEDSVFMEL